MYNEIKVPEPMERDPQGQVERLISQGFQYEGNHEKAREQNRGRKREKEEKKKRKRKRKRVTVKDDVGPRGKAETAPCKHCKLTVPTLLELLGCGNK